MAHTDVTELKMGPQGRVVIPASTRKALGLEPGQVLVGHIDDGRLILERRESVLARLQDRFVNAVPRGPSLADELVADRREESRREAREH